VRKETSIFYRGSRTFFVSSLFFPRRQRSDVFKLYSFLRLVDDYVDQPKPDEEKFNEIRRLWEDVSKSPDFDLTLRREDTVEIRVIKNILNLTKKYDFDPTWIKAFFDSMESDIKGKKYQTLDQTLEYIYGSAEVVGLMMARIMRLPAEADTAARMQGRAFQWINFIRDIDEDNQLKRLYFPAEDLKRFNLKDLSQKSAQNQPQDFKKFMQFQIGRYKNWQKDAEEGHAYISGQTLRAVKLASSMNIWIATQINKNPQIIFVRKIRPNRLTLLLRVLRRP
jgi:phytoene synthase